MKALLFVLVALLAVSAVSAHTEFRADRGYNVTFLKELVSTIPENVSVSLVYFHNYCRRDYMGFAWFRSARIDMWYCGSEMVDEELLTKGFFHEVGHLSAWQNDYDASEGAAWVHDSAIGHSLTNDRVRSLFLSGESIRYKVY